MIPAMFDSMTYADGAANVYHFVADSGGVRFEYDPMTPERSSTGMYSGGPPRAGHLDDATAAALWRHVVALESATHLHGHDRSKGTGQFRIQEAGATRTFILERGAELAGFDAFVAALR